MVEIKIKKLKAGSAVIITDETRDSDDALTTPDGGVVMTITDPDGTVVADEVTMTEISTGKWEKDWASTVNSTKGMYVVETKATNESKDSIKENRKTFELY